MGLRPATRLAPRVAASGAKGNGDRTRKGAILLDTGGIRVSNLSNIHVY
jgi:hypothetical protein